MIVKNLIKKLLEFPSDAKIDWSASYRELEGPIEFWIDNERLRINFDSVEVDDYSHYDYYDECPDCGRNLV